MKGIYQYKDLETGDIVYVGKDSHIDKNQRYRDHLNPSKYDEQQINRVIQNNPDRYKYKIICQYGDLSDDELNWMECMEIMKHKFLYGERPMFNFSVGGDGSTGFKYSEESKRKMSEAASKRNTTGYYRVCKMKSKSCKQGFTWIYRYYEDGKRKIMGSVSLEKLEEKVKVRGLEWRTV